MNLGYNSGKTIAKVIETDIEEISESQFAMMQSEIKPKKTCARCGQNIPKRMKSSVFLNKETRELEDVCARCTGGVTL